MTLDEIHDRLFEILCLIDDICKKENVRYFLDSGTEIASVREKDIIPWDDDIDIKVLREDYPAFKRAMKKHLPEYMHFIEPEDYSPAFFDFIPRVYDERYPMRTETEEDLYYKNYQNRLGIDIFIFDRAPGGAFSQKMLIFKYKLYYGMGMSKRYRVKDEKYSFMQKLQVGILSFIGRPFSAVSICKKWKKAVTKWKNKDTGYRFTSNYIIRDLRFHRECLFESDAQGELRGRKFPIPAGYDEELTNLYGDYMHPPKNRDDYIKHVDAEYKEEE